MSTPSYFLIFIIFTAYFRQTTCCIDATISITQKIENDGFHRTIDWLVEFSSLKGYTLANIKSRFALHLHILPGMYVNPDEIAELNRLGQLQSLTQGFMNVETPMHLSKDQDIYIYLPESRWNKVSVRLPVHLRYQRAQIAGEYSKVMLEKPSLLLYVPTDGVRICGRFPRFTAPCIGSEKEDCLWRNVTYEALFEENALFVPIGNLDDYSAVSLVTLILGCAGCIYIMSVLTTTPL